MTELNLTPSRVARSFDKLTEIVCSGSPQSVKETITRLASTGKIDAQECGLILQAQQMFEHGLTDEAFDKWNTYCSVAMEMATPRMFRFLDWADCIAEASYRTH